MITKSIEEKFGTAIQTQTMAAGALARLYVIDTLRAAERDFPETMPALKEWAEETDGALCVTVEDDGGIEVVLEDGWGETLPSEGAGPIISQMKDWEAAVSQKIREMSPAALLAAGWLEGAECSQCRWMVSYAIKEKIEARADAERLTKKAAELAAGLFD